MVGNSESIRLARSPPPPPENYGPPLNIGQDPEWPGACDWLKGPPLHNGSMGGVDDFQP